MAGERTTGFIKGLFIGLVILLAFSLLTSCSTIVDPSPEAQASGDFTLIGGLSGGPCKGMVGGGGDICRFREGSTVESAWRLIIPDGSKVVSGTVSIYWKDLVKTYSATGPVIEVPLSDFVNGRWQLSDTGAMTALAEIKFRDPDGLERVMRAEGVALIVVLKQGYEPLSLDSGSQNWGLKCRVDYSTAGRSAWVCK